MTLNKLKPRKSLNKAYLKVKPNRSDIEVFKSNLIQLIDQTNDTESEEFHKNLVSDFLKKTYYDPDHFINTKGRNDLVIHNEKSARSTVGVIIEAKKPTNKAEMLSTDQLNTKAFQELVLYYLRERITHKNLEIKYLIATNINEWFVFDANVFEKHFAQNKKLVKQFEDFEGGRLAGKTTDFFYKEIAEPVIQPLQNTIEFTHFDLREYERPLRNNNPKDDTRLIALFKLLSPEHLLKLPFANDSNSLDKKFYSELLHIIGLTETKDKGKKIIQRNKAGERNTGSLLENAIIQLDTLDKIYRLDKPSQYGDTTEERLFNVGLELSITWVNRILFLKLLEAQLISYHKDDTSYSFLDFQKINNYDDLNSLFFQILAKKHDERNEDVKEAFAKVPYLNSSLFEPNELEHNTIFISNLRDEKKLPILSNTVLKDESGKKLTGELNALEYFFAFLQAYDFSGEGAEDIQEDNKTLINASVLGLIFEKINGYKDGSFFTPGFITMYMCRETIRRSVVQKFNDAATPLLRGAGGVSSSTSGDVSSTQKSGSKRRNIIPYNPRLKEIAKKLRNESTKSEVTLWKGLKGKFEGKYDFHRQKPLDNYIADFFCHELKLVIEVDGTSHDWEETQQKDFEKESKLNELGLNVLRYTDEEVLNHLNSILDNIRDYVDGFEKGDLSVFEYEDSPLNPYTKGAFVMDTPLNPLSRGELEPSLKTLEDVYDVIGEGKDDLFTRQEANTIVNSLKICDPAVGSGHFLVSALNEMIAIKNDLKILQDRNGKRLKEYTVEVVNDELVVTDDDGELFEYVHTSKEAQRVQETLFHEKQAIIENCLFGVDINPNSVKICRLRLWIELLKNAYYKNDTELETLPNIDINIKCGNSLISRFDLDTDIHAALKKSKWTIDSYRLAVGSYRNAQSKEEKHEMERLIRDIKYDFHSEISNNDPKQKRLYKLQGELSKLTTQTSLFGMSAMEKKDWDKKVEKLTAATNKLDTEIEEIKSNKIYENAFEWRFEFPEVLNDKGDYVGFDTVIGNPPYIRQEELKEFKSLFQDRFRTFAGTADLFVYFVELGTDLLKRNGEFIFIIPNKWMRAGYGKALRNYIKEHSINTILDFGDLPVFEEATTYPCILSLTKTEPTTKFIAANIDKLDFPDGLQSYVNENGMEVIVSELSESSWNLTDAKVQKLLAKLREVGKPLGEYVNGKIFYGIKTGLNEAFVINRETRDRLISEDAKSEEILKPFLAGRDIKRYQQPKSDKFLIFTRRGIDIENYPAILKYLEQFKEQLEPKPKDYQGKDWTGRKSGSYKWYEIQDAVDYYKEFEKVKIIIPAIVKRAAYAYDTNGIYGNDKTTIIPTENVVLLGLLNSTLVDFYLKNVASTKQNGYFEYKPVYVSLLPIMDFHSTNFEFKVNQILELKKAAPNADTSALEAEIDQLVYELYGLTEEEIAIVEESVE